jgi:hypothetical protein
MKVSSFELISLETDEEHVNRGTQAALTSRYPKYQRFDVRNAAVLLRRPASTAVRTFDPAMPTEGVSW